MSRGKVAGEVARWFGVPELPHSGLVAPPPDAVRAAVPGAGECTLIVGGSGSGKSTLLRAVAGCAGQDAVWVREPDGRRNIRALFRGEALASVLARLGRVGLAEASLLVRRVGSLSVGERFRLALAMAIREAEGRDGRALLACDEFTSPLDDASAMSAAATLSRALRGQTRISGVVATWREELIAVLRPTITARCDYGRWDIARGDGDFAVFR